MSTKVVYFLLLATAFCWQTANSQIANPLPEGHNSTAVAAVADKTQLNEHKVTERSDTVIGSGDLLRISVFGVKAFDEEVRVSERGMISLPLLGDVHVAGLSTDDAQLLIEKKLVDGDFMRHPQVSVFEKEYATQGVSVLGEVQKPGVYPLLGAHRLFDALSMAGGMTSKAGSQLTITHRDQPDTPEHIVLTGDVANSNSANVAVLPGDTIAVSKAGIVYVVGDVKNPMGVVMANGGDMTVLKAVAMAGGANPTAALNAGKIIRPTVQGPREIPIRLKKILAAKEPDPQLEPEDVVFVPTSAARGASRRGLEAILQTATGLAIYRPPF